MTPGGNWEGSNVLRRVTARGSEAEEADLAALRQHLFALREGRAKPGRDDKLLADWNGLTIAALARASAVFGAPDWLATARSAFDFILRELSGSDGRLLHAWRDGRRGARGMLDDYAAMARAALALFEASGRPDDLETGPTARGRGARALRRRRGRRLSHRRRRRRCARRASPPRP